MTDNEIIKALECCIDMRCTDCPMNYGDCEERDFESVVKQAIPIFKRQQQEIERLNSLCTSKDVIIGSQEAEIEKLKNSPIIGSLCPMWKAEAIKEFAERLKAEYEGYDETYHQIFYSSLVKAIDKIADEMTGDKDNESY